MKNTEQIINNILRYLNHKPAKKSSVLLDFWLVLSDFCAPKGTCSEPHPSLKSGENTVQMVTFSEILVKSGGIVK